MSSDSDGQGQVRRLLERLVQASAMERIVISIAALFAAVLVGGAFVFVSGGVASCRSGLDVAGITFCYNPMQVFYELFLGALGNPLQAGWSPTNLSLATTLQQMTLLLFAGLSVAVAFRAGLLNIGTQGQLVIGGFVTAITVVFAAPIVPDGFVGAVVLIPLGVLVGAIGGGLYGAIPGVLKAYADANEVITTIMLNFVAAGITSTLLSWRFEADSPNPRTERVPEYAEIPTVPGIGFSGRMDFSLLALGFAIVLMVGIAWLFARTSFGYELRTSGIQPAAAAYGGVNEKRMTVASMTLSGALGGIAGAFWVLMVHGYWLENVPSIGFDGIAVSVLAGSNPLGVGAAAFLFGLLKSGSESIGTATSVPPDLVGILTGLIILFVAMPEFFRMIGRQYVDVGSPEPARADGGSVPADEAADGSGGEDDA
ncbi:ABC transporter permease [Natrialba asiatica]|uniref:ABC transporter integral membrane protein n=1 Tax=Natrialba asiatica (strain ATCC 700177 / DSM 12278 / JCM 9576 / FERM P-10747 / NBRC 102637 / 172P1) TaxID=29540 RepID=M0AX65_NATA1|nr:ABC transporter permease [Natrialba asiatica]ELZ02553.1 ABC transporter integral membrane protein [Natrialba asiatica DSM 12278]